MPTERPSEPHNADPPHETTQSKFRAKFRIRPRGKTDEAEKKKQLKDYLAWVNNYLKRRPGAHPIADLRTGLQDGIALVNLVEVVANAEIPFVDRAPASQAARKANLQKAISFLTSDGVRLSGDPVKDILDGSVKGVLRVILAIAEKYNPRSVRRINSSDQQHQPSPPREWSSLSYRADSPDRPHDTLPINLPTAGVSLSQGVAPAVHTLPNMPLHSMSLSQGATALSLPVSEGIYSTPVDSLPQNVVQRISSHMPPHRLIGPRKAPPRPRPPSPKAAPAPPPPLSSVTETVDEQQQDGMMSLQLHHELGTVLKQLSVFKTELLGLHSLLIENGDSTDGIDGASLTVSGDLVAKEREIADLHQQVLVLKEQLEKDHSERQTLQNMVQDRNQFITSMKSEIYRKEYRNDTQRVDMQTQLLHKDKIISTLEAEVKALKDTIGEKENQIASIEESSSQQQLELCQQLDCVKAELGRATAAEESLHAKLNSRDKKIAHLEQQEHGERRGRVGPEELDAIREQLGALRTAIPSGEQQLVDTLEKSMSSVMSRLNDRARSSSPPKRQRRHHEQRERRRRDRVGSTSKGDEAHSDNTKVFYYMGGADTPYVTTVPRKMSEVRLKDFKSVFDRRGGMYRFYFKTQDPDCGVVREEVVDDESVLPCYNGKIMVWVNEKTAQQHK